MNFENLLVPLVVGIVMYLLFAASKKKPKEDGLGGIILKLPKLYPIIGLFVIIAGIGLVMFAFFWAKPSDTLAAGITSLVALAIGLLLFAKGYISSIRVTESGLKEITLFGKEKEIMWTEIENISFGKVSLELKVQSANKKIKAHMHLVGFPELVKRIEEKTGKSKIEMGIPD